MQISYGPRIDATKILSRRELALVLTDLKAKAQRSSNARMNLILVRLACCCGLRVSEIASLQVGDVRIEPTRPHLRIRRGASKGGRSRVVPLWWDAGTLRDLAEWKRDRAGAAPDAPFVGSLRPNRRTQVLSRHTLRRRFKTACRVLGLERLATLTIHHGRHTFISHALCGHRSLAEVRDAAGHANVSITSAYLHVTVEDEAVGDLFGAAAT
jgi:integrase/recombinase XerD